MWKNGMWLATISVDDAIQQNGIIGLDKTPEFDVYSTNEIICNI